MNSDNKHETHGEITLASLQAFRDRFGTFHDDVIHSVHYNIFSKTQPCKIFVILGVRDLSVANSNNWINLNLEITGINNFLLNNPPNYYMGVILRLNIGIFDNKIHFNFFPFYMNADDIASYNPHPTPGPNLVIVADRCQWSISPYLEHPSS